LIVTTTAMTPMALVAAWGEGVELGRGLAFNQSLHHSLRWP
jgi:hypothetical protein